MLARGLVTALITVYQFVIAGGAGITGLEYLQPGPNFVRVCCNIVSVSASELVYNAQTNTTTMVPIFTDVPVASMLVNSVRLTRENMPPMNASTISLGPDTKLEVNKMYAICMATLTSPTKRCFTFRPCDCGTCTTTKPWLMFNITNVAATDTNFIQLYTQPIFTSGPPTLPITLRLRLWDGMMYRSCLSYPNAALTEPGGGCGLLQIHANLGQSAEAYLDETTIWPSGTNASVNYTEGFAIKDDNTLNTVTAGLNVTMMMSVLGSTYENGIIEVPNRAWNRNGYLVYSQIVPYATPTQTNGYLNAMEDTDADLISLCQQVLTRRAADQPGPSATPAPGSATAAGPAATGAAGVGTAGSGGAATGAPAPGTGATTPTVRATGATGGPVGAATGATPATVRVTSATGAPIGAVVGAATGLTAQASAPTQNPTTRAPSASGGTAAPSGSGAGSNPTPAAPGAAATGSSGNTTPRAAAAGNGTGTGSPGSSSGGNSTNRDSVGSASGNGTSQNDAVTAATTKAAAASASATVAATAAPTTKSGSAAVLVGSKWGFVFGGCTLVWSYMMKMGRVREIEVQ